MEAVALILPSDRLWRALLGKGEEPEVLAAEALA